MRFFGKSGGDKGAKMSGEQSADLGTLQAQRDKHQAALAEAQSRIDAIEEATRVQREEAERKQKELARLEKCLKTCLDAIAWTEKRIAELQRTARGQIGVLLEGKSEAFFTIKSTLQEIREWEGELGLLKEYEVSLPQEIEKLTAVSA